MNIIQEAKGYILSSSALEEKIYVVDLISRLVDMLEWKNMDSCPIGEAVLAVDESNYVVSVVLDINRRPEIVVLGDMNNDYPICNKWLPLPPAGER